MVVALVGLFVLAKLNQPLYRSQERFYSEIMAYDSSVALEYTLRNSPPPSTLQKTLDHVDDRHFTVLRTGKDPWGNPLIYNVTSRTSGLRTTAYQMTIQSFGPDGIDNQGAGDDILGKYESHVITPLAAVPPVFNSQQ